MCLVETNFNKNFLFSFTFCLQEHCYETMAGSRECKVLKTEDGVVKTTVTRYEYFNRQKISSAFPWYRGMIT